MLLRVAVVAVVTLAGAVVVAVTGRTREPLAVALLLRALCHFFLAFIL